MSTSGERLASVIRVLSQADPPEALHHLLGGGFQLGQTEDQMAKGPDPKDNQTGEVGAST